MHNTGMTALMQAHLFGNNKVFEYEEAYVPMCYQERQLAWQPKLW
jgi:hypothetical protein